MLICLKDCYPIGPFQGDPPLTKAGDKIEAYETYILGGSRIECWSIRRGKFIHLYDKSNFIDIIELRNDKIEEILNA